MRLENIEVKLSHLEYRIRCIEINAINTAAAHPPSEYNITPLWTSTMGYQMPASHPSMLESYNQMSTPSSMVTGVNVGINGGFPLESTSTKSAAAAYNTPSTWAAMGYQMSTSHLPMLDSYNQMSTHTPSTMAASINMEINSGPSLESTSTNSAYNTPSNWSAMNYQMPNPLPALRQSYNMLTRVQTQTPPPVCAIGASPESTGAANGPPTSVTPPQPTSGPFLAVGKPNTRYLPSSAINKDKLRNIDEVIAQYPNYVNKPSAGTLCQIFARESVFGKDVLACCTVSGNSGKTALPLHELNQLKIKIISLLPKYVNSPAQFESLWKTCTTAIEQAIGRHRREYEKRK